MAGNLKIPLDHISTGVFLLRFLQPLIKEVEKILDPDYSHKQTEKVEPYSAHCTAQWGICNFSQRKKWFFR